MDLKQIASLRHEPAQLQTCRSALFQMYGTELSKSDCRRELWGGLEQAVELQVRV